LCALALGLGGTPQDLSRQKNLSEFIRNSVQKEPEEKKDAKRKDEKSEESNKKPRLSQTAKNKEKGSEYKKAVIEIALVTISSQNKKCVRLIERTFDTNENSFWKLNDKKTSERAIHDEINRIRIFPSKLTQFLPQERISALGIILKIFPIFEFSWDGTCSFVTRSSVIIVIG
jgi:hypothetical protein